MRKTFSKKIAEMALADPRILLLTGDHGYSLWDEFRRVCPDRYINAGIAEQNMVGMAAGLARSGFLPFVYGLSAFVPVRVLEQIKLDLAHDKLPVVLIGDGAGFVYSYLGTSHQAAEDIAALRPIPNMQIFSPADRHELARCMELLPEIKTTTYLRLGKEDLGDVHDAPWNGNVGDVAKIKEGNGGLVFLATGAMVKTALEVVAEAFPDAQVWSAPFIKPIDEDALVALAGNVRAIVTLEEHSIHGGLGGMVAETLAAACPRRILRVGIDDKFSGTCGTYAHLRREHGLDAAGIIAKTRAFLGKG